eukprot:TRINITY_DN2777_c0_g1_i2.p1 TRINITY_DN2777_c0_g1~~TRINITY_DN2777_c0_g1_i2.p1  ORF type:complete len:112 (+),score=10.46 TRINITY_DN2777_c0_g1_i2:54-389(+)
MLFCQECNNMLYPKEDRNSRTLNYHCRICKKSQKATDNRVYHNEIRHTTDEQTTVIQDLAADPTLPRTSARCTKCGHKEAVYFQSSSSKPDEAMTLYFICCNSDCGHKWKE